MPGIFVNNIVNLTKTKITNKPHLTLILIILMFFTLIFLNRLFGVNMLGTTILILGLFTLIISSTILRTKSELNELFNSISSRNFMAIFLLVFFIIYVYEDPFYDSSKPNQLFDKLTNNHNKYISNRTVGLISLISFSIITAYTVYLTTRTNSN